MKCLSLLQGGRMAKQTFLSQWGIDCASAAASHSSACTGLCGYLFFQLKTQHNQPHTSIATTIRRRYSPLSPSDDSEAALQAVDIVKHVGDCSSKGCRWLPVVHGVGHTWCGALKENWVWAWVQSKTKLLQVVACIIKSRRRRSKGSLRVEWCMNQCGS